MDAASCVREQLYERTAIEGLQALRYTLTRIINIAHALVFCMLQITTINLTILSLEHQVQCFVHFFLNRLLAIFTHSNTLKYIQLCGDHLVQNTIALFKRTMRPGCCGLVVTPTSEVTTVQRVLQFRVKPNSIFVFFRRAKRGNVTCAQPDEASARYESAVTTAERNTHRQVKERS